MVIAEESTGFALLQFLFLRAREFTGRLWQHFTPVINLFNAKE